MGLQLITDAAEKPMSLAEAKLHLRIDGTDEDANVTSLISRATNYAEQQTGRALVSQQWRLILDGFPSGSIKLPLPPLASVESITYTDTDGATQTLSAADYLVNPFGLIGEVSLAYGKSWPETRAQAMAVQVVFTCGYADAASVPQAIKAAILLLIGHLDQNREAAGSQQSFSLPTGVEALLSSYVVPSTP
jgi:uncharacterized phiE125 gp8 family phage protein